MALLACQLVSSVILGAAGVLDEIASGVVTAKGEILKTALSILFQFALAAAFFGFIFIKRTKPDIFLKPGSQKPVSLRWGCAAGVLLGLVCIVCFAALSEAGQRILRLAGYKLSAQYTTGISAQDAFLLVITVLLAPVCEELVFRSALASGLKKRFNRYVAALLVGLAFSLMHMNPEQTIYQFFLGFGAALLAIRCESVIPAIAMHVTSNIFVALNMIGVPFVRSFFNGYARLFASSVGVLAVSSILLAAAGVAVFIFGTILLKRFACQKEGDNADIDGDSGCALMTEAERGQDDDDCGSPLNQGFLARHRVMLLYACGLAVSLFMWVSVFIDRITV